MVKNCKVLREVLKENNNDILQYFTKLKTANPLIDIESLIKNFHLSTAAYSMITYVLMIGDRHFDNILINNSNGQIFHIDFGHVFGHEAKIRYFNQPIRFTNEMKELILKCNDGYKIFITNLANIFYGIRTETRLMTNILYLMMHSSVKELNNTNNELQSRLELFYSRFLFEIPLNELENKIKDLLEKSVNDKSAYFSELFHSYGQN